MTSSLRWSNGRRSGSNRAELPPPAGGSHLPLRRGSLAGGMSIRAAIEARLLGIRLLRLRAAIDVLPADVAVARAGSRSGGDSGSEPRLGATAPRSLSAGGARSRSPEAAAIGSGLPDAVRALRAGSRELQEAREQMP